MKMINATVLALFTLGTSLMGCAMGTGEPESEESSAQNEDALINNGGGFGYQCTTSSIGTSCSCTEGVPLDDAQACGGMRTFCRNQGWTVVCIQSAGGKNVCGCGNVPKQAGGGGHIQLTDATQQPL